MAGLDARLGSSVLCWMFGLLFWREDIEVHCCEFRSVDLACIREIRLPGSASSTLIFSCPYRSIASGSVSPMVPISG
jgi:hypothetical protein